MSDTAFVLIVDQTASEGKAIADALDGSRFACNVVDNGAAAMESIRHRPPDVIVADGSLQSAPDGIELLREAKRIAPETEVLLLTSVVGDAGPQEILRQDDRSTVFDLIPRPVDLELLRKKVSRAAQQAIAAREARLLREQVDEAFEFYGIIGTSEVMRREIKRLTKIARSKGTVLIFGETGTG
jgi:two-component system repressor protein LuxO